MLSKLKFLNKLVLNLQVKWVTLFLIIALLILGCGQKMYVLRNTDDSLVFHEQDHRIVSVIEDIFLNNGFDKVSANKYEYFDEAVGTKYIAEVSRKKRVQIIWVKKSGERVPSEAVTLPDEMNVTEMSLIERINSEIEIQISNLLKRNVKVTAVVLAGP